jgi:ABC-type polysaccharide/polyol phosphate transport system ATPase subunit
MTDLPVIVADHISKRYFQNEQRLSLRHEAANLLKRTLRQGTIHAGPQFWALQDVSFSICASETVGIIGRNGAGKSTLLRVLSGITVPTTGQVSVRGNFATLISLGAGFNPERTGRQNIYLNAAIQGKTPAEIAPILDEIIQFAELADFIDLPIKRYSTGMMARLGFSIAINILPEIIFVDEILSVGDAAFQQKCIQRMINLKAEGRTLILVSHTAEMVKTLCARALWIDHGRLKMDGPTEEVMAAYDAFLKGDLGNA